MENLFVLAVVLLSIAGLVYFMAKKLNGGSKCCGCSNTEKQCNCKK